LLCDTGGYGCVVAPDGGDGADAGIVQVGGDGAAVVDVVAFLFGEVEHDDGRRAVYDGLGRRQISAVGAGSCRVQLVQAIGMC
jgi:hypothetical protein